METICLFYTSTGAEGTYITLGDDFVEKKRQTKLSEQRSANSSSWIKRFLVQLTFHMETPGSYDTEHHNAITNQGEQGPFKELYGNIKSSSTTYLELKLF